MTAQPAPPDAPAVRRPPGRALQITAITALVGVLVALVGIVLVLRPLQTPTQDCGTSLSYLLQGRLDQYVDPAAPPEGATRADVLANNTNPCQERAANRARPALVLVVGGTLTALIALVTEVAMRFRRHRADVRERLGIGPRSVRRAQGRSTRSDV